MTLPHAHPILLIDSHTIGVDSSTDNGMYMRG